MPWKSDVYVEAGFDRRTRLNPPIPSTLRQASSTLASRWLRCTALLAVLLLNTSLATPPAHADNFNEPKPTTLELRGSSGFEGAGVAQPQRWTLIGSTITNRTDEPHSARLLFRFAGQPQRQFLTNIWLPPQSNRHVILPVRFGQAENGLGVKTELILLPDDRESEIGRQEGLLSFNIGEPLTTALYDDDEKNLATKFDREYIDLITELRRGAGLGPSIRYLSEPKLMRADAGWDGVTLLSLTADHPILDAAQRRSIRRFIEGGGTLLVAADQLQDASMQELLGDDWGLTTVDRHTLTDIQFDSPTAHTAPVATMETEKPIVMARMIAGSQWRTLLTVTGWPALLERDCGAGKIIATTVGGRAWTAPSSAAATRILRERTFPMRLSITGPRTTPADAAAGAPGQQFVAGLLGYQIVPRAWVALSLGAVVAVVLFTGLFCYRQRRLEYVGVTGILASLVAAALLLGMGQHQRGRVDAAAVSLQWIQAAPGSPRARITENTGLYIPDGGAIQISSDAGGYAWPAQVAESSRLERVELLDLDRWRWPEFPIASGAVRPFAITSDFTLAHPISLDLRFGPKGVEGSITLPNGATLTDPILATSRGNMRVDLVPSANLKLETLKPETSSFRIDADAALPPGEILGSGVIAQQQQDRAAFIRNLEAAAQIPEPTLLFWTEGLDTAIHLTPSLNKKQQAIWSLPLRFATSAPGSEVRVPWMLIPMEPVRPGPKVPLAVSPIYRPDTQTWLPQIPGASAFVGRFTLPRGILPLKLSAAVVHLNITAPGRTVRILTVQGDAAIELAVIHNPDGPQRINLPVEKLQLDDAGSILLAFDVQNTADQNTALHQPGRQSRARESDMWTIRAFGLEAAGVVQKPN